MSYAINPQNPNSLMTSIEVDALALGATSVFTLSSTRGYFYITEVFFSCTTTGAGTDPVISIGWNGPAYSDIVFNQAVTDTVLALVPISDSFAPAATSIFVNVDVAATLFTQYDIKIIINGFYTGVS